MIIENMTDHFSDHQRASSAASTSSSLSYLSFTRSPSLDRPARWIPRRRHAPPPMLPTHRRARSYADLLPFEVSQLASVLCHGPPISTPRDGAVWTTYVSHTNERMALLGSKLRAATTLPSFLPWSINHSLCSLHRRLNAKPLEDIFAALRYEVETRTQEIWQSVALAGGLSASQTEQLALMDEIQALWLSSADFMQKFNRLPTPKYGYQTDGCVACILARMGGNLEVIMALGALLLGSMRRSDMLSTRVCFCREWVRYIVGDVDCVDTALAKMDKMGTKLREARRWARQRKEATSERPDRNLGLGGMPYVQPKRVSSRQTAATTGHQDSDGTGLNTIGEGKKQHLGEGHSRQRAVTVGEQVSERYSPEQLPPEPISAHDPSTDLYSPEQYYSTQSSPAPQHCLPSASLSPAPPPQSNQPIRRQCQPEVQSETWEERNILLDASIVSTASRKDSTNLTPRHRPTSTTSLKIISPDTIKTPSPNPPSSSYSECVTNPFLDGSSSPFSPPSHDTAELPPDLPFRLFNWRRAESDSSPPKEAVPFPIYPASPKRSTADRSKDGLSPVPTLARLGGDRGVGALWRRRIEKMTVSEGGNK
ncbi:hypothetical protein D6C89_03675 [Aureobasidium pullulans]|uniref:Uncharacterized protein n=1 Tax=Aureobasidium pullulans TaxID=5580 RepID=A0A4S9TQK2_AURPU|nr:hypothetical protein D6D24_01124 [Aureobasidium pullulans]THZ26545.1 hypothetical protein D6C89_03675 [Aureobasidium pullulans]